MLRTSEQLPFEIFKKLIYFASEPDSNPSAILLTLSISFAQDGLVLLAHRSASLLIFCQMVSMHGVDFVL